MPVLHVQGMKHLRRGRSLVSADGTVHNVRLKRHLKDEKKIGIWSWSKNPFTGTPEWYRLRVLMAVMNNWDLKDMNNSIYLTPDSPPEERYVVSDLGASFGPTGLNSMQKGNPAAYCESKWIKSTSTEFVDFNVPSGAGSELLHQFSGTGAAAQSHSGSATRSHAPMPDGWAISWGGSRLPSFATPSAREAIPRRTSNNSAPWWSGESVS